MTKLVFNLDDAKHYTIDGGECYLYPDSPTGRLSAAYVEQDGRYPLQGYRYNEVCTEAFFVISGKLKLTLNKKTYTLKPRDVVYVPPNTKYSVEGKGKSFVFIEPKWDSAQNKPSETV